MNVSGNVEHVDAQRSTFSAASRDQINISTDVNIDLGTITQQLRESIGIVQDNKRSTLDKEEHARLCVYRALSVHPALSALKPPTQVLGDLDWYTELKSPLALLGGPFKKLGQNDHFRRTSNLGEQGRRTRIMMLLCWVIGHRLPQDKARQFISTTVGDALSTIETGDHADMLLQLHMVRKILEQLAKMIRTQLPLPKERNPFYGDDFVVEDEDKLLPRAELWVYSQEEGKGLLPDEIYEFDVKHHPSILLRPLTPRVLVPQTKLSLLAIQWVTHNFGLGKKVFSRRDVDSTMFWNADPPYIGCCPPPLA